MSGSPDLRELKKYFKSQPEVRAAFLFGSVAKKTARATSDIDLALLLDSSVLEKDYLEQRMKWMDDLSKLLKREVDVIVLNESGPVLIHQVLRYGKLLYETDHTSTTAFKAHAMIDYVDWL